MISGTRPFHQVIPLKFVHLPFHHLSLCFTHVLLRDKKCSQGLKSFFYPRPKGSKKKKKKSGGKDDHKVSHAAKGRT